MSIPETALIFAGIPLGFVGLVFAAIFLPSEIRSPGRYRPGRPWQYEPSWYLPHQIVREPSAQVEHHAPAAILAAPADRVTTPVGGASGEW
jgi:hypothetical protein